MIAVDYSSVAFARARGFIRETNSIRTTVVTLPLKKLENTHMPRQAHWLKPVKTTAAPTNILVFDTETWHGKRAKVVGGEYHTLRLGSALAYRLESGKRTREKRVAFTSADLFWNFVDDRQSDKNPLWVFAHNLPYDLGIVDGWRRLMSGDYDCKKFALTNTLSFLYGSYRGKSLNFCDTINYYKCPLEEIGKAVGLPKMQMPAQSESDSTWQKYCDNDVEVTARGIDSLIEFTRHHKLGSWGPSIASLAMNAFKAKFLRRETIAVHTNVNALRIERGAYFGGITECNIIGKVRGPIHELDVCSMYPAMCMKGLPVRIRPFPGEKSCEPIACSLSTLGDLLSGFAVIADVTVNTSGPRFPVRNKDGTVYPRGTYRTCLTDPELCAALSAGCIQRVHGACIYESMPVLAGYMKHFSDLKISYNTPETMAYRTLTKYYLNALYGKFGQQTPRYLDWGRESLQLIEDQYGLLRGTLEKYYDWPPLHCDCEDTAEFLEEGVTLDIRDLFGNCEIKCGHTESRDSFPALAATVTAYARIHLRELQHICGSKNWYYSDTDSLWVNDDGLAALRSAGCLAHGTLGMLEHKGTHQYMMIYGPKDYETDKGVKVKGIKMSKSAKTELPYYPVPVRAHGRTYYMHRTLDGGYRQVQFPSAISQIRDGRHGGVFVRHLVKRLYRKQTKWKVGPGGWTTPLQFPEEHT